MRRRNKPYRPRPVAVPMLVGNSAVFAAPRRLLEDIRHRYVLEARGSVMMPSTDDALLYHAGETLRLIAGYIRDASALVGRQVDPSPLERLAARLDADMPIDDAALLPAERAMAAGQAISNRLTASQALEILRRQT